jgi:hypothetical protein
LIAKLFLPNKISRTKIWKFLEIFLSPLEDSSGGDSLGRHRLKNKKKKFFFFFIF